MKTAWIVLGWVFSILFILIGIGLGLDDVLTGMYIASVGFYLSPNAELDHKKITFKVRIALVLLSLTWATIAMPEYQQVTSTAWYWYLVAGLWLLMAFASNFSSNKGTSTTDSSDEVSDEEIDEILDQDYTPKRALQDSYVDPDFEVPESKEGYTDPDEWTDVEFVYESRSGESKRNVMLDRWDETYFEGFCMKAAEDRTFRFDRITSDITNTTTGETIAVWEWEKRLAGEWWER